MADSTIDSELIVLDNSAWGVTSRPIASVPTDGFTGADHHNVSEAAYPLGTTIEVYNSGDSAGVAGFSTFIYLNLAGQDETNVLAAKHIVGLIDNYDGDAGGPKPFYVTNEAAHDLGDELAASAVALSAMTTGNYGWFWNGGVCPEEYVSGLGGNYPTDGTVAIGPVTRGDLASAGATGEFGFAPLAGATSVVVGYALAADA